LFGCDDLTVSQGPGSNPLIMSSKPYRNKRIILAIRELYFAGGGTSVATRYDQRFPRTSGVSGVGAHQVPISMVALVATAVSASLLVCL
jgi:hypothetical protein